MRVGWSLTLLFTLALLLAPPVADAQLWRLRDRAEEGEPTDPNEALAVLSAADVDLDDYGLSLDAPAEESALDAWWDALIAVMTTLGLVEGDSN
jgi:hypothetical protein